MKTIISVLMFAMIALFVVGCEQSNGNVVKQVRVAEPLKIGFVGPLSGDVGNLGQNALNAVNLAVEKINSQGGIYGRQVVIVAEDGKCSGKDAINALNKLMTVDKVELVIGGLCSSETLGMAPVAESSKVVLLSSCSSNPSITSIGDYTFRNYPSDSFVGSEIADLLMSEGKDRAAVIACQSDYCIGLQKVFVQRFTEKGGEIVSNQEAERQASDLRTQLTKVKESKPDAIVFFGYTAETITAFKQAAELGLSSELFIGSDAWNDDTIWSSLKEVGEGARFMINDAKFPDELNTIFKERFGAEQTVCTPQSYDAPFLLKIAVEKAESADATDVKNALYAIKDYEGVSGRQGFDENGDLLEADFVVREIRDGKSVVVN